MKKRQYTYNEVYRSVNKITTTLNDFNDNDIYKTFKDFLTFITVFRHIEDVIKRISKNKTKDLNKITLELIESNSSRFKEVLNTVLNRLVHTNTNYLNEIKEDLFPEDIQVNFDEIDLDFVLLIIHLEDTEYNTEDKSFENKQTTYYNLSTDIMKILSVKDVDELINIFMNVHHSNRNRYYLTHSFKTQVLPHLLSQYVHKNQNLVCLGLSPHNILESYKNSFLHTKQQVDFKSEETEVYFEDKGNSKDYYNTIYSLIYNLKSFLPYVYTFENEVEDNTKDTLVVSIYDSLSDLTPLKLYEKSLETCTNTCFVLVPYSFISTRIVNFEDKSDEEIKELKNSVNYLKTIEQINQHKELVDSKQIEKIITFPNNYFTHTVEPQVLLQISKEPVESIQFIDLSYLDKPLLQIHKYELFKVEQLKEIINSKLSEEIYNTDSHRISKYISYEDIINIHNYSLLVNNYLIEVQLNEESKPLSEYFEVKKLQRFNYFNGRVPLKIYSISEFKEFSYTKDIDISKSVTFEPLIPPLKLKEILKIEKDNQLNTEQLKEYDYFVKCKEKYKQLLEDEEIFVQYIKNKDENKITKKEDEKYQKYLNSLKKYTLRLEQEKQFQSYQEKLNIIKTIEKQLQDYRKFQKNHQLQDYDILMYVHSTKDITILKNTPIYCVGNHNLLRLRVKEQYTNNIESLSKSLYLFLLSETGQKTLEKILLKSKTGKDVISIEMLEQINVDFSDTENQVKKFDEIEKKQRIIDKLKKDIINIIED